MHGGCLHEMSGVRARTDALRVCRARAVVRRGVNAAFVVMTAAGLLVVSCASARPWRDVANQTPPRAETVRAALVDEWPQQLVSRRVAALDEPSRLRPCCAFGLDLKVAIAKVPVPGFAMKTVRGPEEIGPHDYAAGLLQIIPTGAEGGANGPATEHNGIVYTSRGGFIDTAHARDYADLTCYLAGALQHRLERGAVIELADQGGKRRVVATPVPREVLRRVGRLRLSVAMAQWLAFELSVWREIATWYGHKSVPPWPETISSFSLEDLYSNLLGTKLAGGILRTQRIRDEEDWSRAMTAWLPVALEELGIQSATAAAQAMRAVDGDWWDSSRRVPDWKLVRGRSFEFQDEVRPWLVPGQTAQGRTASAVVLRNVTSLRGTRFRDYVRVEIVVDEDLVERGLTLPRSGSRSITQVDFPAIVERVRRDLRVAEPTATGCKARQPPCS